MVEFIAYHGSVEDNLKLIKNKAFYLTDDYLLAKDFAYREIYDDGLYDGEIPIVYAFKGEFKNPYYLTEEEYDDEGQDSNIDYKKWVDMGVDGIIFKNKGYATYYIVINPSTIKLIGKKYLPYDKNGLYRTDTEEDNSYDYQYSNNEYDEEINEVLKRAGIQINEEKIDAPFQIPEVIKDNFKITNSLKDASKWKAKIIENNSNGDESIGVGDWNNIGYVMISLKDNTIIPIARADEHKQGYELLYELQEKYGINASDYYSVWCLKNSANYPYNKEEGDLLKKALIKCKSYGMDLSKSLVYMKYIDPLYRDKSYDDSMITAEDFINDNYQTVEKLNTAITNIGNKLIDAFKLLSESFSKTNIRGKYSIANINKAIKNLYNIGSKIILKDNFKLVSDMDLEQMQEFVQQYKEGYYNNNQLSKVFFGFMGFRNNFHQRLRKNIDNKMLEKQLGSVEKIIEIIGSI